MLKLLTFITFVGLFSCGSSASMSQTEISTILFINTDINDDREVTETEFLREFVTNFNDDGSGIVSRSQFEKHWTHTFQQSKHEADHVFQHFDLNGDGNLAENDLLRLFHHMDYDNSDTLTKGEFYTMLVYIYGRIPYD